MHPFLSFKNQFGLWFHRRTAEKKHVGEFVGINLGCVEITYHFSHHIFRTKVAINLDSNLPCSVCGTSAPAAPDRTMTLYVCIYIYIYTYIFIYIYVCVRVSIQLNLLLIKLYIYIYIYIHIYIIYIYIHVVIFWYLYIYTYVCQDTNI